MGFSKFKKQVVLIGSISALLFQTGCSSMGKSVGLGTAIGAGSGAMLGGIVDPGKNGKFRTRNVIIGAGVGALAGGLTGAAIHENNERDKELAYLKGKEAQRKSSKAGSQPSLQRPKVEAVWVESKVVGNRYIEGHFEYIITEPTRWESP
jgi:high-affinity Fe2+/Pb2+ permease